MISVIIATKNRATKLTRCVTSILSAKNSDMEIIIVDQSDDDLTRQCIAGISTDRVMYLKNNLTGKSRALNEGSMAARGNILAFTDDDCIVSRTWLSSVTDTFATHPSVSAVFGQTKPDRPSRPGRGTMCPSVFPMSSNHIIDTPCYHADHIGFGNNMAIKKNAFQHVGGFRTWLGPGSIGLNAEDADMAIRLLLSGHTVYANKKMLVFHDRWLTRQEARKQEFLYAGGEAACYGYFGYRGQAFAKSIWQRGNARAARRLFRSLRSLMHRPWNRASIGETYWSAAVLCSRLWGTGIAWYFSKMGR